MSGRFLVTILLVLSIGIGGLTFYYQNYAYYQPVTLDTPVAPVAEPAPTPAPDTPLPSAPTALGDPEPLPQPEHQVY